jgi:hypothetical protein
MKAAAEDVPPKGALKELFNSMFADCKIDEAKDATTDDNNNKKQIDAWAGMVHTILAGDESSVGSDEINTAFENWECNRKDEDEENEFAHIEAFITKEIKLGIGRRKKARDLQAGEELT